ncbi:MAG: hypothetical protein OEU98_08600 [Actinomycetota bacterium]|nr:hypothetical protein [Actinomycetota bacterium]
MARLVRTNSMVERLADRRLLAGSGLVWLVLAGVLFASRGRFSLAAVEQACGLSAPDVRFAPAAADTHAFLARCGADGLAAYRDLQLIDLLYPAAGALVLVVALALILVRVAPHVAWLALIPLVAAMGDYLENAAAWALLGAGGSEAGLAAQVLQVGSAVKVVGSWVSWLMLSGLLIVVVVRALARRRRIAGLVGDPA